VSERTTRLLRTIRLDPSDAFVFDPAAAPGEWAVPGAFMFWDGDPAALSGRARQAFRSGFLGLTSFGWSTLAVVVAARAEERAGAVESLARFLLERHGAPDLAAARGAAEDEIAFAESLARQPEQTLVALHRTLGPDGAVREQFRTFARQAEAREAAAMPCSAGAFAIIEEAEATAGEAAGEEVDLARLVAGDAAPGERRP
jgi:hypothetical protein